MPKLLGRILCLLGLHDYRLIDVTVGFGPSGSVAKVQCTRCGRITTRRS